MAEFPAPSAHARTVQASGNGLQRDEEVLTAISFHRNRLADYGTFAVVARYLTNEVRKSADASPHAAPPIASRVGQYRDGLLAITSLHLLLYRRRGLVFGYKPEASFENAEVLSITSVKAHFGHPLALVFVDGSSCELDAATARERRHLLEVLAAQRAAAVD